MKMSDNTFEQLIEQGIKRSILSTIEKTDYVQRYHADSKPLPKEFLEKVWAQVDWDAVLEQVKPAIHTQICNAVIGNIQTEIKTDVKSLLSVDGVRQKLRMNVYPELMKVLEGDK